MRISAETHERVQRFFREYREDEGLVLPRFFVHIGPFAGVLMAVVGMGAITFGRHVFVRRSLLRRDSRGRILMPGWLLVHEAAHVLQYEERGFVRFLFGYLLGYWRALRAGRRWDARSRMMAYLSIEEEREARAAERAYVAQKGDEW